MAREGVSDSLVWMSQRTESSVDSVFSPHMLNLYEQDNAYTSFQTMVHFSHNRRCLSENYQMSDSSREANMHSELTTHNTFKFAKSIKVTKVVKQMEKRESAAILNLLGLYAS